jgi:hypothetical protein
MKLTRRQSDACQTLLNVVGTNDGGQNWAEQVELEFFHGIDDNDDPVLDETLDDPDDEENDDNALRLFYDEPFPIRPEVSDKIAENTIQTNLLELLLSFYTHLPTGAEDKFWSPIVRFIVLYSIKRDGGWLNGRQITQIFAALLFCGRLLMMVLMHRKVLGDPGVRYSA